MGKPQRAKKRKSTILLANDTNRTDTSNNSRPTRPKLEHNTNRTNGNAIHSIPHEHRKKKTKSEKNKRPLENMGKNMKTQNQTNK